jgi:hypothetical protein
VSYLPLQVDVVGWFVTRLTPLLTTARVGTETPADTGGTLTWVPFVQVERTGGPNDNLIMDIPTMAFHCFDLDEPKANQLGYAVIGAVRGLRGIAGAGAILQSVRTLSGPSRAATDNQALRHVVVLMQPRIKTTG